MQKIKYAVMSSINLSKKKDTLCGIFNPMGKQDVIDTF